MIDITIVMALYKPNKKWLIEELESIYKQTYHNFQVLIWNDCPEDSFDYNTLFRKYLHEIPFSIYYGKENLGSNGVFEKLTELTNTQYIAYCDQDDIWLPNKLFRLRQLLMENQKNLLAFSDMMVIDEKSKVVAENIQKVRPRQLFYPGKDALIHLLVKNFVTGCTVMMRTDIAKEAIPFPSFVFHDWWLAVFSAIKGKVVMSEEPLMQYRIYGNNQSAVLKGINDKKSYYKKRILPQKEFMDYIFDKFKLNKWIIRGKQWTDARERYFCHPNFKDMCIMLSSLQYNKFTILFEVLLPLIPKKLFAQIIQNVQKGKI